MLTLPRILDLMDSHQMGMWEIAIVAGPQVGQRVEAGKYLFDKDAGTVEEGKTRLQQLVDIYSGQPYTFEITLKPRKSSGKAENLGPFKFTAQEQQQQPQGALAGMGGGYPPFYHPMPVQQQQDPFAMLGGIGNILGPNAGFIPAHISQAQSALSEDKMRVMLKEERLSWEREAFEREKKKFNEELRELQEKFTTHSNKVSAGVTLAVENLLQRFLPEKNGVPLSGVTVEAKVAEDDTPTPQMQVIQEIGLRLHANVGDLGTLQKLRDITVPTWIAGITGIPVEAQKTGNEQ